MATYSVDAISVLIGEVPKIHSRPNFESLWGLKQYLITRLKKIENTDHPNNGHSGYLMPANKYALVSLREYDKPDNVREYFEIPAWTRTNTAQKSK